MTRLVLYAVVGCSMLAGAAVAQTANGSPSAPAAGGGTSTTAPSGGKSYAPPNMSKAALAAKTKRDKEDEKRLEHDLKICIGC